MIEEVLMSIATFAAAVAAAAPVPPPGTAEAQLRGINHARRQAWAALDPHYFESLVGPDFRFTGADGAWLDRAQFVALAKEPAWVDAAAHADVKVRLYGPVGLVHATVVQLKKDGTPGKLRVTDVYHWDGDRWRLVSAQLSPIQDPANGAVRSAPVPAHARWRGADPEGDDEQVLRALNEGYVGAFLHSDVGWYDAHLAPDYLVVFGDGSFHDKSSLLEAASHPVTNMRSFPVESVVIRRFGDVAIIHAENPYEMVDGRKGVNRYTDIWHKRDGRWLCVAAHVTRFKAPV